MDAKNELIGLSLRGPNVCGNARAWYRHPATFSLPYRHEQTARTASRVLKIFELRSYFARYASQIGDINRELNSRRVSSSLDPRSSVIFGNEDPRARARADGKRHTPRHEGKIGRSESNIHMLGRGQTNGPCQKMGNGHHRRRRRACETARKRKEKKENGTRSGM